MELAGQQHTPAGLTPGKGPRYPSYRGWVSLRAGRKISPPQGFESRTFQPTLSHYTDWAIRADLSPVKLQVTSYIL
jgi:hypothetical protein